MPIVSVPDSLIFSRVSLRRSAGRRRERDGQGEDERRSVRFIDVLLSELVDRILDRNSFARSDCGAAKNASGVGTAPRSCPSSMKTTRWATRRAKPISWVTTIIVMPSRASVGHDVEHLVDHLGVERRGGLVEQHDLGLHGERAGDGHPLLLAAREVGRIVVGLVAGCRPARAARARSSRPPPPTAPSPSAAPA